MMSNQKYNFTTPILFSVAVSIGMLIGYKLHSNLPTSKSFFSAKEKNTLEEVIELINKRYVDKISADSIGETAIQSVLASLDPHSNFIPASELTEMNESLEGKFEGIGIEFNIFNDTVHVLSVLKNGPSDQVKLEVGDKIIQVGEHVVVGIKNVDDFKQLVKGPAGTEVNLSIIRGEKLMKKDVVRGNIPISSVDASYMIDKESGYLKINRFAGNTYREFMTEIEKLKSNGMQKLVLDLRDNGGGILEEAVNIADEFLSGDKLIVYTEGLHSPRKEYKAKRPGIFEDGKLVLLINENSASASEVLAGALQDHDRAQVVGIKSFGKGLVQEQYALTDGSALRLTIARYYTPLGRCIQKSYTDGIEKYHLEIYSRKYDSTTIDKKPTQSKVFKSPNGKLLYNNDGIMPDFIVKNHTEILDTSWSHIFKDNLISRFSYSMFMTEKTKIMQFENPEIFYANFDTKAQMLDLLKQYAGNNKIMAVKLSEKSKQFLSNRIKAHIAKLAWDQSAFFYIINKEDSVFTTALSALH